MASFLAMDAESGELVRVQGVDNAAGAQELAVSRSGAVSHFSANQASVDVVASPSSRVEVVDAAG